jgi:hypothetical protein
VAQVVESLPSKYEARSSNPTAVKKKKDKETGPKDDKEKVSTHGLDMNVCIFQVLELVYCRVTIQNSHCEI